MGVYFSNSLLLYPISSIDTFSDSYLRVKYFRVMRPSSSINRIYILSLLTPAILYPDFKVLSSLALSLIFTIFRSAWSLDSYFELTLADISLDISSK